jgi:1-acyl-sn-glycerol-3-phosphate acyltransferase
MVLVPLAGRLLAAGRPRAFGTIAARATWRWSQAVCAIVGIERDVRGAPPTGGVLLAANHVSYIDIVVLGSLYPCLFVAKSEIASWPFFGAVARLAGTLFVDRGRTRDVVRTGERMAEQLEGGIGLTLFPEGRAGDGAAVGLFLPSLFEPAARAGVPCWAASLSYETPGAPLPPATTICWHDHSNFLLHFGRLLGLKRIRARVTFSHEPARSDDRKELARSLRASVSESFVPIRR